MSFRALIYACTIRIVPLLAVWTSCRRRAARCSYGGSWDDEFTFTTASTVSVRVLLKGVACSANRSRGTRTNGLPHNFVIQISFAVFSHAATFDNRLGFEKIIKKMQRVSKLFVHDTCTYLWRSLLLQGKLKSSCSASWQMTWECRRRNENSHFIGKLYSLMSSKLGVCIGTAEASRLR